MPDWFYRTIAQPLLFRLSDKRSRALALGGIGFLGKRRFGRAVIDFLGHMDADPSLAKEVGGIMFSSAIGVGWRVDPERRATQALARFGVGCIEILDEIRGEVERVAGPFLADTSLEPDCLRVPENLNQPVLRRRLEPDGVETVTFPNGVRIPVLAWDDPVGALPRDDTSGVCLQVGERRAGGGWRVPLDMPAFLPDVVCRWRTSLPDAEPIIVSGGVRGPEDARALVGAGADLVLVDAGLIYSGPGLVKRCNEALLVDDHAIKSAPPLEANVFRLAWVWAFALGLAMAVGGLATAVLAITRVILPYDEHYLGLTSVTLRESLPLVFGFMAHDRGTLAGVMMGLGGLYLALAWWGIRRGAHGAKTAVIASALTGFATFFSFFGFGYFDTLHAFVAIALLQLSIQVMVGESGETGIRSGIVDIEDLAWRRAQWGQLLWVIHAVGLIVAGAVILGIGMTSVFVREDLAYLCMTGSEALALGDRMVAVIAHDRATLGGMLLATGVASLLPALWGFRRGERWLWRAFLVLGLPAYVFAVGVHFAVGYVDWRHLAPVFSGFGIWAAGLVLTRNYLCGRSEAADGDRMSESRGLLTLDSV